MSRLPATYLRRGDIVLVESFLTRYTIAAPQGYTAAPSAAYPRAGSRGKDDNSWKCWATSLEMMSVSLLHRGSVHDPANQLSSEEFQF